MARTPYLHNTFLYILFIFSQFDRSNADLAIGKFEAWLAQTILKEYNDCFIEKKKVSTKKDGIFCLYHNYSFIEEFASEIWLNSITVITLDFTKYV